MAQVQEVSDITNDELQLKLNSLGLADVKVSRGNRDFIISNLEFLSDEKCKSKVSNLSDKNPVDKNPEDGVEKVGKGPKEIVQKQDMKKTSAVRPGLKKLNQDKIDGKEVSEQAFDKGKESQKLFTVVKPKKFCSTKALNINKSEVIKVASSPLKYSASFTKLLGLNKNHGKKIQMNSNQSLNQSGESQSIAQNEPEQDTKNEGKTLGGKAVLKMTTNSSRVNLFKRSGMLITSYTTGGSCHIVKPNNKESGEQKTNMYIENVVSQDYSKIDDLNDFVEEKSGDNLKVPC